MCPPPCQTWVLFERHHVAGNYHVVYHYLSIFMLLVMMVVGIMKYLQTGPKILNELKMWIM